MSKFISIFFIFAISISLLSPLPAAAETTDEGILRIKIQILQLQIEILKAQIALLSKGIQIARAVPATTPVSGKKNCAQLEISWGSVQRATGYKLYRNGTALYEGKARSFVDSGLVLGEKYRYVVYGLYNGEQGEPSEVQEITAPDVCPPKIPSLNFKAKPCGGQITITWTPDIKVTVYELFRGNRKIYSGPLTRFIDSGLKPHQTYEYKIRAGNQGGWSDFSTPASFQASGLCAPSIPEVSYVIPEASQEGILSAELRSSPVNNIRVRSESTNQSVMAFNVKAWYSDITITKVDLFFDSRPWIYLDKIKIQYAGRTIAEEELDQESFSRLETEDIYQLRFGNLKAVVKDGSSGIFTVRVDAKEFQLAGSPYYITVFLKNNSIRGVDGAGIWQYAPKSGGGKEGSFVRTFRIE